MAEGTAVLFTNFRTGEQLAPSAAIGTSSITNAQLAGSITNDKLAGPIVAIIGTASVSNSQLAGPIVALIGTASITASQLAQPIPGSLLAIIEDQKAQNTAGGTFTSGADQTRTLNTLVFNLNSSVSLASNQFALPAGTWDLWWAAPGFRVGSHQTILFDVTNTTVVKRGGNAQADSAADSPQTHSFGVARVSISAATAYEIRHRGTTTRATDGFGFQCNFGTEVYTQVVVRAAPTQ